MAATYSKPTAIPRWADTGTRVEPTSGKKDTGWIFEEAPPYGWENWIQGITGDWIKWLDERFGDGATKDVLRLTSPGAGTAGLDIADLVHTHHEKVVFTSGETNATTLTATGKGTGHGANFTGGSSGGYGIRAIGGGTGGGGYFAGDTRQGVKVEQTGTPYTGTLNVKPITVEPTDPEEGDVWVQGDSGFHTYLDSVHQTMSPIWANIVTGGTSPTISSSNGIAGVAYNGVKVRITFKEPLAYQSFAFTAHVIGTTQPTTALITHDTSTPSLYVDVGFYELNSNPPTQLDLSAITRQLGFIAFAEYF